MANLSNRQAFQNPWKFFSTAASGREYAVNGQPYASRKQPIGLADARRFDISPIAWLRMLGFPPFVFGDA
jgi:hypothetical protein